MSERSPAGADGGRLAGAIAFVLSAEPPEPVPRRALVTDAVIAAVALCAALVTADLTYHGVPWAAIFAAFAATVPLAARRRFPLAAFLVLLGGAIASRGAATDLTFLAVIVAAYSAAMHSRFRGLALILVALAGALIAYLCWKGQQLTFVTAHPVVVPMKQPPAQVATGQVNPKSLDGLFIPQNARWRLDGLLTLVALVSIAIMGGAAQAGQRIRRLQAEHEAATRRALASERARIASELHDVVTHNVSVMIVQAGAARQVLDVAPGQARAALLAVESSGRAAMAELRHLLGLLSPAEPADTADGQLAAAAATDVPAAGQRQDLWPQPGLRAVPELVERMRAAGLPVDLSMHGLPADLPPGVDLAAFRVIQEALTNVLKHAGKPATSVRVDYHDGCITVEVTDAGRPIPAVGPVAAAGSGRGLFGLRARVGVYGGELTAGPRPGGGWQVRARIPVDPLPAASSGSHVPKPAGGPLPAPALP